MYPAGDAEDEGREGEWVKEWVKGRWVKGAICGVKQSEERSKTVGGGDPGSEADEGYRGGRQRRERGGCQSSILGGSPNNLVKTSGQNGEDCGGSGRDGV